MRRPRPLHLALAAVLLAPLLAACGDSAPSPPPGPPRHVVLVIVDTLRRDALSCYGNTRIATPGIDALAADGTRFDAAISASCWTLPSVASILTGTWPTVHKASGRQALLTPISPDVRSAPEVLREAGFRTLAVVNAAFLDPLLGLDRGFEVFDHVDVYNARIRRADESVRVALQELARAKDASTFLLVHLFDPHLDYDPPAELAAALDDPRFPAPPLSFRKLEPLWSPRSGRLPTPETIEYVRAVYEADVAALDAQIARLAAGMKELGIYDDATIVLTSDHGEELWDHGGFEHGHAYFDELIRVPLIVKLPRDGAQEPSVSTQVRTLDVFPTLFDAAGVAQPDAFVGSSLAPLCRGGSEPDRLAFSESNLYEGDAVSWRTGRWKYVLDRHPEAPVRERLYDLAADPGEATNLADDPEHAGTKARLASELAEFLADVEELGAGNAIPERRDMSPGKNREYLEWMRRMSELGYTATGEQR